MPGIEAGGRAISGARPCKSRGSVLSRHGGATRRRSRGALRARDRPHTLLSRRRRTPSGRPVISVGVFGKKFDSQCGMAQW